MKKLKIIFVLCTLQLTFCVLICNKTFSQSGVSINSTGAAADPSAMLDISSLTKGLLVPRVYLTSTTDVVTIPNPANSLLVYNLSATMTGGGIGFWYYNSTIPAWVQAIGPMGPAGTIGATGPAGVNGVAGVNGPTGPTGPAGADGAPGSLNAWGLTGNTGTDQATNFIGTTDANDWVIKTNNTEKMRVTTAGKVGIGVTAPTATLEVNGTLKTILINELSDIRYKKDITTINNGLLLVNQLRGVNYNWRTKEFKNKEFDSTAQIGVIAQEVEKVLPQVVFTDTQGFKSVDYSKLTAVLIEAIKEQQITIEQLQSGISALNQKVGVLQTEINSQKAIGQKK